MHGFNSAVKIAGDGRSCSTPTFTVKALATGWLWACLAISITPHQHFPLALFLSASSSPAWT